MLEFGMMNKINIENQLNFRINFMLISIHGNMNYYKKNNYKIVDWVAHTATQNNKRGT